MPKLPKKHSRLRRRSSVSLIVLSAVVLLVLGFWLFHKPAKSINYYPNKPANVQYQTHTTSNPGVTVVTGTTNKEPGTADKQSGSNTSSSSSAPAAPVGTDLVSNYKISLSQNPTEQSSCNVQPGTSCDIEFINGSQTIDLGKEQANSSGYIIWDWTPHGVGLSVGDWTIKAIASLISQQSTTTAANQLEVSP